jgi:hypothetical protein
MYLHYQKILMFPKVDPELLEPPAILPRDPEHPGLPEHLMFQRIPMNQKILMIQHQKDPVLLVLLVHQMFLKNLMYQHPLEHPFVQKFQKNL